MKVTHISTSAYTNSSCTRLSEVLLKNGVQSEILTAVNNKNTYEKCKNIGLISKIDFKLKSIKENNIIRDNILDERPVSISKKGIIVPTRLIKESDIIHLHWINGGYIGNNSIENISKLKKKIVWTLHDSWLFTAGCHITNGCTNYINRCEMCTLEKCNNGYMNKIFIEKENIINNLDIDFIVPSYEHYRKAKLSPILKDKRVSIIPNTIDENIFFKKNKVKLRSNYHIDPEKIILTFGAVGGTRNKFKGVDFIIEALKIISRNKTLVDRLEVNIFGGSSNEIDDIERLGIKINKFGYINDQEKLSEIYSIGDIFISPSLEESFGQTIAESIYCGNIAIAFDSTGASDIIEHKKNGYLAEYKNLEDLVRGIKWCIENRTIVNDETIQMTKDKFSPETIANKHIDIYKNV